MSAGHRPVHIAGFAQLPNVLRDVQHDETESVREVTSQALAAAGLQRADVGFYCSGSNDYVMGRPFSFAMAIDGLGAWPPVRESHVEMDGAWALYEAWVALQCGDFDVALVYGFGRSSMCNLHQVHGLELDPYTLASMGLDPMSLAAMQARVLLDKGLATEEQFAQVVADNLRAGADNPKACVESAPDVAELLSRPRVRDPLRAHDEAIRTDGAAAIVLRVGGPGPRIEGIAHCIDVHQPGFRDLSTSPSAAKALAAAGGGQGVEVAELHAPYSSQQLILQRSLGLGKEVLLNPSGGSFASDTPMVAGLIRIGEAAAAVNRGASRALAHATSGPCLQHNLVCVLGAS
jgi:acetyl-CoA acetyltransferase